MWKLYLAGLPRLQSVASVLHCQGSDLADESHSSSTYPLGTGGRPNGHGQIDIINKAFRAVLQGNRPGYFRRTPAAVAARCGRNTAGTANHDGDDSADEERLDELTTDELDEAALVAMLGELPDED